MDIEQILDRVQKDVRALLIASKIGLSIQELEKDYKMMIGSNLPLRTLGYRSTMEMVLDMPNVVTVTSKGDGTVILSAVVDEATKGIAALVSRQKEPSKTKCKRRCLIWRPRGHVDIVRRGRTSPVLPATVKSELRDLLSISPLLVSEFEKAFLSRFGRTFQYTRYGFYSMLEVIGSISDIVEVKQTRAGSLLTLRNSVVRAAAAGNGLKPNPFPLFKSVAKPMTISSVQQQTTAQGISKPSLQNVLSQTSCSPPKRQTYTQPPPILVESLNTVKASHVKDPVQTMHTSCTTPSREEHHVATQSKSPENLMLVNDSCLARKSSDTVANDYFGSNELLKDMQTPQEQNRAEVTEKNVSSAAKKDDCMYWLEAKLEKELKLCLARKGAGGSVSPDLRLEIQNVLKQHPQGLLVSQLPVLFKSYTGKELPYKELGFMSVMELIGSLGDMLHMESTHDGKDWYIYDMETKSSGFDDHKLHSATQSFSNWSMPQPQEMQVKPVGIKVCKADANLWWGPLESQIPSSEESEIPPDAVRREKLHCLPRMKRGFMIGVYVENVTSPSEFYVRCYGKDTSEKLEDMMIEMRRCYSSECVSSRYMVPDDWISVGEIYALRAAEDVWWYRVIVHAIVNPEEVTVFYPDFGNVSTVKRSWLRLLKQCYMKLPAQAVPSCLAFVTPVEGTWSTRAMKRFQQHCGCGPLVGLVLQYVVDILYLFLCDTSSDEDVYLHQLLTSHNLAHVGQEPGFYKTTQKSNPFLHYLKQYPIQPPEERPEDPVESNDIPSEPFNDLVPTFEETQLEMPYLEAVTAGAEVWDENWLSTRSTATPAREVEPSDVNLKICQDQNSITDFSADPNEGGLKRDSLEEFYISIIKSRKSQETVDVKKLSSTRDLPDLENLDQSNTWDPGNQAPFSPVEEKPCENKHDFPLWEEPTYYQQNSLNPFKGLQKLQIPRSTMVALGPAARLATAGNFLSWITDRGNV